MRDFEPNQKWDVLAHAAGYRPAELAQVCGVSLRTLQRHFRKSYNMTVREWLRASRLQSAYGRIKAGEPIKRVAIELGYKQLSHFSRDFKREFGMAPRYLDGGAAESKRCSDAAVCIKLD